MPIWKDAKKLKGDLIPVGTNLSAVRKCSPSFAAMLDCGHIILGSRSDFEGSRKRTNGFRCNYCRAVEAAKETAKESEPAAPISKAREPSTRNIEKALLAVAGALERMGEKVQKLDERLTQVEDVKTAPELLINPDEGLVG